MSTKFFYLYIVLGSVFIILVIYDLVQGHPKGYTSVLWDAFIALLLYYRAYRVYKTKQDHELM